jgi:uncharacterized protein (DUF1330 family)
MSAYMIVELTVRDAEAKNRYSAAAGPILKSFGGEFLVGGAITTLFGEQPFTNGSIICFPDREAALGFYNSPDYQALLDDRALGIDCRFSLLG